MVVYTVTDLMTKVEAIGGVKAVNGSLSTGKLWSSAQSMAEEVSRHDNDYNGGESSTDFHSYKIEIALSLLLLFIRLGSRES